MRRSLLTGAIVLSILAVAQGSALASWGGSGAGQANSSASSLPVGDTPTAVVTGRNIAVSWGQSSILGQPVNRYTVQRYDASTGVAQTIGASCDGTVNGLTCTEAAVPPGSWRYAVTPVMGAWVGLEGPRSSAVTVGSPSLSFTSPTTFSSVPTTLNGDIANFVTGETITFRLDDPSTGPVLSGSVTQSPIPTDGQSAISVTIPNPTAAGVHTVYAVGSSGAATASAGITIQDLANPSVTASAIAKTAGGTPGFIKRAGTYHVYANVTDPSPSSGISSVTANVAVAGNVITTGQTAAPMTAGSYAVGGTTYNYRSASITANTPLAAGAKAYTVTATDGAAHSVTQGGFSVTVDNTAPNSSSIATTNVGGGTTGHAETGDTVVYTYNEQMDPNSILAGWDGASANVTFRLIDGGAGADTFEVWDSANTTQSNLGTCSLQANNYTAATVTFTNSTIVLSGATITVTLGTPSGATGTGGVTRVRWTPSALATDRAGNASGTTARNSANTRQF